MRVSDFAVAAIIPLLLTAQSAVADSHSKAVEYRQAVMTAYGWNLKPMGAMVSNKAPYEAGKFKRHAMDLATAARLDLLGGFPEDSEHEDSDVKSEIWLDWENFEEKYRNFQEKAMALKTAAESGDLEKIRPAFGATAKSCKDCHKAFRE
ncbi:MAG: cytochrome c [Sedimenticola sp.]